MPACLLMTRSAAGLALCVCGMSLGWLHASMSFDHGCGPCFVRWRMRWMAQWWRRAALAQCEAAGCVERVARVMCCVELARRGRRVVLSACRLAGVRACGAHSTWATGLAGCMSPRGSVCMWSGLDVAVNCAESANCVECVGSSQGTDGGTRACLCLVLMTRSALALRCAWLGVRLVWLYVLRGGW